MAAGPVRGFPVETFYCRIFKWFLQLDSWEAKEPNPNKSCVCLKETSVLHK